MLHQLSFDERFDLFPQKFLVNIELVKYDFYEGASLNWIQDAELLFEAWLVYDYLITFHSNQRFSLFRGTKACNSWSPENVVDALVVFVIDLYAVKISIVKDHLLTLAAGKGHETLASSKV